VHPDAGRPNHNAFPFPMKSRQPSKLETISLIRRALRAGFTRRVEVMRLPLNGRFAVLVFLFLHRPTGQDVHLALSFRGMAKHPGDRRGRSIAIAVHRFGPGRPKTDRGIQAAFEAVKESETRAA